MKGSPKALTGLAVGAVLGVSAFVAGQAAAQEQVIPSLVYRTGAFAPGGISLADGEVTVVCRGDGLLIVSRKEFYSCPPETQQVP